MKCSVFTIYTFPDTLTRTEGWNAEAELGRWLVGKILADENGSFEDAWDGLDQLNSAPARRSSSAP